MAKDLHTTLKVESSGGADQYKHSLGLSGGQGNSKDPEVHIKMLDADGNMKGQGWFNVMDLLNAIDAKTNL